MGREEDDDHRDHERGDDRLLPDGPVFSSLGNKILGHRLPVQPQVEGGCDQEKECADVVKGHESMPDGLEGS